jgi:hypothetical protein
MSELRTACEIRWMGEAVAASVALCASRRGWYLDSGQVVAYMKPSAGTSPALVRETIYQTYAARPESVLRRIMARLFISRPEIIAQQSLLTLGKHLADGCDYDVRLIKLNVFRALVGDYQFRVRG